jgi:hypothetical protein
MAGPLTSLSQAVRNFWGTVIGRTPAADEPARTPPVVLHDPAAQRPHDLDDPFFDDKVQSRMADVIASAGQHQKK